VRQHGHDDLYFILEAFDKERTDRAVDEAGDERLLLGGAAFTLEIAAGDLARRVSAAGADASDAEGELFRRFAPRVRLYGLRHLRDPAEADDLVSAWDRALPWRQCVACNQTPPAPVPEAS